MIQPAMRSPDATIGKWPFKDHPPAPRGFLGAAQGSLFLRSGAPVRKKSFVGRLRREAFVRVMLRMTPSPRKRGEGGKRPKVDLTGRGKAPTLMTFSRHRQARETGLKDQPKTAWPSDMEAR
jgi:hypothetical protein